VSGQRRWGWHRLNERWAEAIVAAADIRAGDLVIDLGAGTGGLTLPLLDAGARVIAVELHSGRARRLRQRIDGRNAVVVECDLRTFSPPGRPFRVVANPPFALTSTVLDLVCAARQLRRADLVLQRGVVAMLEAGERRSARRLQVRRTLDLPRSAFVPPPPVECSVVCLTNAKIAQPARRSRATPPR
jgi:23S rRNA (adenine-N6)-dimethyltransferase